MMARRSAVRAASATGEPKQGAFEKRLVARIIELASQFGRYGYRRITALWCGLNLFGTCDIAVRSPDDARRVFRSPLGRVGPDGPSN